MDKLDEIYKIANAVYKSKNARKIGVGLGATILGYKGYRWLEEQISMPIKAVEILKKENDDFLSDIAYSQEFDEKCGSDGEIKAFKKLKPLFEWSLTNCLYKNREIDFIGFANGNLYFFEVKNWYGEWCIERQYYDDPTKGPIRLERKNGAVTRMNPYKKLRSIAKSVEKDMTQGNNRGLNVKSFVILSNDNSYLSEDLERTELFLLLEDIEQKILNDACGVWTLKNVKEFATKLQELDEVEQSDGTIIQGKIRKQYYSLYEKPLESSRYCLDIKQVKEIIRIGEYSERPQYQVLEVVFINGEVKSLYDNSEMVELDVFNGKIGINDPIAFRNVEKIQVNSFDSVSI